MSFMHDTDLETQKKYYALLKAMSPEKRFEQGMRLTIMAREACQDSIRQQYPDYTWEEVRKEYLRRIMTPEEFKTMFGKGR
jgi:hypothetical protein